jgi:hypothetical protein
MENTLAIRGYADGSIRKWAAFVRFQIFHHQVRPSAIVYDLGIHAVNSEDILFREDFRGSTDRENCAFIHQDDAVGILRSDIEIMADHYDQDPLVARKLLEKAGYPQLMLDVQIGCRLVEEKHLGFLYQAPRQHHFLVLPCRKLIERAHSQILDAKLGQGVIDYLQVLVGGLPSGMRMPSHQDCIDDAERECVR